MPDAGAYAWSPERSVAGGRNPWTIVGVISIATFMVVLDTSIANVALAHIAGSLSASYDEATWVVTSFLVANAVVIPVSGWLADVIGRKRYYMISIATFTIASFLCGISSSLSFLVVARIVQGIGGGGLAPVEQSMLVDTFPPEKRGAAMAAYGVVVIVGPIFGPTIGGWITDNLSWGWVFLINLPVGAISLVLVSVFVDEPEAVRRRTRELREGGIRIDFVGFALVALALGCLEITLDRGQREDWFSSNLISICAAISALCLLVLVPWEFTRDDPVLRVRMYCRRNFAIANILMLVMGIIVFGSTQFIPQLLQEVLGYTATDAGLALTAGGIATLMVMPIAGLLTGRVDPRILIGASFTVQVIALWNMSTLSTQMAFRDAAIARMIQSVGLPFLFVPVSYIAYIGLRPEQTNQASALLNVARNLGGTIGISVVQTLLARRAQFHQSHYVESLNPLNPNYTHAIRQITHALMSHGLPQAQAMKMAPAFVYRRLLEQSAMLSYIDAFHVLMIVVACALPLIFIMQGPQKGAGPPAGAAAG